MGGNISSMSRTPPPFFFWSIITPWTTDKSSIRSPLIVSYCSLLDVDGWNYEFNVKNSPPVFFLDCNHTLDNRQKFNNPLIVSYCS